MVGIEAKIVWTKKTIRCCTAYFRGHGENLRSFCTQRVQKNEVASQGKLYTHHLKTLYEKYEQADGFFVDSDRHTWRIPSSLRKSRVASFLRLVLLTGAGISCSD